MITTTTTTPTAMPMGYPHEQADFWTKVVEGTVHLVEKLCPPLERSLQWDFSDCGAILSIEDECCILETDDAVTSSTPQTENLVLKMGVTVPNAARAA